MHEAGLMRSLMRRIETVVAEHGASRAVAVEVWLGALSHMSPAHFEAHFEHAAPGTCAEGARIAIETSDDLDHPHAHDVVLKSVEVET